MGHVLVGNGILLIEDLWDKFYVVWRLLPFIVCFDARCRVCELFTTLSLSFFISFFLKICLLFYYCYYEQNMREQFVCDWNKEEEEEEEVEK